MNESSFAFLILIIFGTSPSAAQTATEFDGLYYPSGAEGWSCDPVYLGQDGGAVSIADGYLDGVENRCELTNPQPAANGAGITFTAVCAAEGETYFDPVTIIQTSSGVSINRSGRIADWTACPETTRSMPMALERQDGWVFDDGVASIRSEGNYLEFSCIPASAASTIPTARMSGCPLCWMGDEIKYNFSVDGAAPVAFTFTKQSNAEGMTSDLYGYPAWQDGIIVDLIAGRILEVFEGDALFASFPLNGSSAAFEALRDKCN